MEEERGQDKQEKDDKNNQWTEEEGVDEAYENGPAFISANDDTVVEVDVDLENEPMEEEDDEGSAMADGVATSEAAASESHAMQKEEQGKEEEDVAKHVICCHDGPVYSVASVVRKEEGVMLASGGGDDKSFLSTLTTSNTHSQLLEGDADVDRFKDTVSCVAFNFSANSAPPSTAMLAAGCYDGTIKLWDVSPLLSSNAASHVASTKPKFLRRLDGPTDVEWLAWHPNGGTVLLAGSTDGTIWMWFTPNGKCMQVFIGHEHDVTAGTFTPNGKFAVSIGADGTLRVWAPKKGTCRHLFQHGLNGTVFAQAPLTCMAIMQGGGGQQEGNAGEKGQLLLTGAEDGTVWLVHLGSYKVLACMHHHDTTSNEGTPANSSMTNGDDDAMEEEHQVPSNTSVEAVSFAPPGTTVNWCATAGANGKLKIWDLSTPGNTLVPQCRQVCVHSDDSGITSIAWHSTLPLVYTAGCDGRVKLWDARNGTCIHTMTGHTDVINDMTVLSSCGGRGATSDSSGAVVGGGVDVIVTASDDQSVRVFEVNVEQCLAMVEQKMMHPL